MGEANILPMARLTRGYGALPEDFIPTKVKFDGTKVPKTQDEFDADDFVMMEKNSKAIKILYFDRALMNITVSFARSKGKGDLDFLSLMKVQKVLQRKNQKRESRNKNKSSEKGQFQGCFKCGIEGEEVKVIRLMAKSDTDLDSDSSEDGSERNNKKWYLDVKVALHTDSNKKFFLSLTNFFNGGTVSLAEERKAQLGRIKIASHSLY
ncbi:hypothetical protein HAX54_000285 [Datura stramonium]|uniref:Uncharacterized protein n=1 Tax=Datura stramonium TaxID=4076 RepID=A0ABS8T0T9_DATST|nr:hypothetical protein [Datura stramonium]